METQIGNLDEILMKRPQGALPSQIIANHKDPRAWVHFISLRSGKVTQDVATKKIIQEEGEAPPKVDEQNPMEGNDYEAKKAPPTPPLVVECKHPFPFPTRFHTDHLKAEFGKFMKI
ncbi:unnamed protein product [Linum trigynum]|uniref:Uncharacterized protein n=1 Tax=Linum trigynum TaxID=586398 RepID=A0AAV2E822_9ROSI